MDLNKLAEETDIEADVARMGGKIVLRFAHEPRNGISPGMDDAAAEYVVAEVPKAVGGVMVWGKRASNGVWECNWGERHAIRHLLGKLARVQAETRAECIQVATMFGEGCMKIAAKEHAAGEYTKAILAESGAQASKFIAEAFRALNNAQGVHG